MRDPIARENLAVLRHIALSRRKDDDAKIGIQNKRLQAGWNEDYLTKLLFGPFSKKDKAETSGTANISKD
ncbi:hypothetical protein [Thiorhodococcus mannitoliphagus]|uniref:hypothetical protein n=1 Tax=Thiorhodococcus mannitoliphagus TaxID=329406 RepID=UPI001F0EE17C|nr:hypothetical protein [Thiorhodococcus mannitoliphagus]